MINNVIIGIARVIWALYQMMNDNSKINFYAKHLARGVAEIIFGPLLILVDSVLAYRERPLIQNYLTSIGLINPANPHLPH